MIKKFAQKYTGKLRSLKLAYVVNNFLNRKKLAHNKALYKKYGIKKSIYSPLGKEDVKHINMPGPWIDDQAPLENISDRSGFNNFSKQIQDQITQFIEKGYMIIPEFYTQQEVNEFNVEIQTLIDSNQLDFNYTGKKIMESYKSSPLVNDRFFRNQKLLALLSFLFDRKPIPFHTINFIEGSEQKAHSDSIHMSTVPEGFMAAAWVALESTDQNNGPLFYYPGSHRFPFISCLDYESGNSKYLIGEKSYANYEEHISELIASHDLKKEYFYANPGDLLIWHSNLLHGGDPILEKGRTRKSMVGHFFADDVLCFHEISQRPALLDLQ